MRVLILDQYSDRGGAQRMLLESLCAIREQGWNAWVAMPGGGSMFAQVRGLGFRAFSLDIGSYSTGRKSIGDSVRFALHLPRLSGQIAELAAGFTPDVVYINGPRVLPAAAMARLQAPVLFHAHIPIASVAQRWLSGISLRELNASVATISESVAQCWRPFARVGIIRNGVAGPPAPPSTRLQGPPRIGCIGRISPEKGQREFLQVAARILESIPESRFFVYGASLFDDPAAKRYEAEVRDAAAGLPVEFCGWVDDIYEAFENLDLLLVPSVWPEPNALVILEAFAAGVPVIAFRTGGIPEFLDQLAATPDEMAAHAVAVLADRALYDSLAASGRRSWENHFQPARYRREIAEALRRSKAGNLPAPAPQPARETIVSSPPATQNERQPY